MNHPGMLSYSASPMPDQSDLSFKQQTARLADTKQRLARGVAVSAPGEVYFKLSNPTTLALEKQLTQMEGGISAIATSSGSTAIATVMLGLLRPGDEIVSTSGISGRTVSFFENTLRRRGVGISYIDSSDADDFGWAINGYTRLLFVETLSNPGMQVPDIPQIAALARSHNIPLIVDNTLTPLVHAGTLGASIVVQSMTPYLNGHGNAPGGIIVDTGNYNWARGQFPEISKWIQRTGPFALNAHLRQVAYRDLGGCPAATNSFFVHQRLETLAARMKRHSKNALRLAEYVRNAPHVVQVHYPGLPDSPYQDRVQTFFGGIAGGMLTCSFETHKEVSRFLESINKASAKINLRETRTQVIHPASTTFKEFDPTLRTKLGAPDNLVSVTVGLEDFEDIKGRFDQALEHVSQKTIS